MAKRHLRERRVLPLVYELGGQWVFTLRHTDAGTVLEPKPGRHRLTPAQKEEAASMLSANMVPHISHDEAFDLLFATEVVR